MGTNMQFKEIGGTLFVSFQDLRLWVMESSVHLRRRKDLTSNVTADVYDGLAEYLHNMENEIRGIRGRKHIGDSDAVKKISR